MDAERLLEDFDEKVLEKFPNNDQHRYTRLVLEQLLEGVQSEDIS